METLRLARNGPAAIIELSRPETGHGLNEALGRGLADAAAALEADDSVRAVVLTASGKFFCAGGDVKAMASFGQEVVKRVKGVADAAHHAVSSFVRMKAPVIVAVNGVTAGGGVGQAMAGDTVLAAAKLANGPRGSHAAIKQLLLKTFDNGLESQMEDEGRLIAKRSGAREGQEGIKAFCEKRTANFNVNLLRLHHRSATADAQQLYAQEALSLCRTAPATALLPDGRLVHRVTVRSHLIDAVGDDVTACSLVRIDLTWLGRSGGLAPTCLPCSRARGQAGLERFTESLDAAASAHRNSSNFEGARQGFSTGDLLE